MKSLFLLKDDLMLELSENAQAQIQGGITFDLDQSFSLEQFGIKAANGPNGSFIVVEAIDISSDQFLDLIV